MYLHCTIIFDDTDAVIFLLNFQSFKNVFIGYIFLWYNLNLVFLIKICQNISNSELGSMLLPQLIVRGGGGCDSWSSQLNPHHMHAASAGKVRKLVLAAHCKNSM